MNEDVWLPLVDEPLGEVIDRIQAEDTQITSLIGSPRRQLAFRTFAYLRVGILLGGLLVERDVDPRAAGTWVDQLLEDPEVHAAVLKEVRAVAGEVASDPRLAFDEALGPDEAAVGRFREFARRLDD
ncbi:MAG: hypothetical protein ACRDOG_06805 [Gaiellaceae bacterium]